MDYAKLLNPSQLAAVENTDGASVIVAGAGSGKTRVLTYKIAYLIEQGIPASSILALTFTNKAAREMRNRIQSVVGMQQSRLLWMGTFHSIFLRILRIEATKIGFNPQFTVYDTSDSKSLIKSIIKGLALDEKLYKPSVIQNRISAAKNSLMSARDYANAKEARMADSRYNRPMTYKIYELYQQRMHEANVMDFDDLLMHTALLFMQFPEVLERYQERFQYVMVDEYQDTNAVQHRIVTMLARKYGNVCVVGDDAQSIYSFRGAEIDNILSFQRLFEGCKLFKLEQNYRSTQTIVNAANSLIEKNRSQIRKRVFSKNGVGSPIKVTQCMDDNMEAEDVAQEIMREVDGKFEGYSDIAILYRTNAQSRVLEDCFRRKKIPYKIYGGLSFYQRKEIKDAVAYLRLIVNHEDIEALKRIINVPSRGIGKTTIERLLDTKSANIEVDMLDILCEAGRYCQALNSGACSKLLKFGQLVEKFTEMSKESDAHTIVHALLTESGLLADAAMDTTAEGISRFENLQEFEGSVLEFCEKRNGEEDVKLTDFISEISLITDQDNSKTEGTDTVTLMTMHAAKGLEFDTVFVTGAEENLLPSQMALTPAEVEEERRLLYVAITRAKESCFISFAQSRFLNGQRMFSEPSRFINDIDAEYLNLPRSMRRTTTSPVEMSPATFSHDLASSSNLSVVSVGMRVIHAKFGKGTVTYTEGTGENARAKVKFDTCGEKTLILKFARLKSID